MNLEIKNNLTDAELDDLSFDDYDEVINPKPADSDFDNVVEEALSRRGFMSGVLAFGGVATLGVGTTSLTPIAAQAATNRFGFDAVATSIDDTIVVPDGYNWHVAARWGDPLFSDVPEFDHETRGTAASQARAFGDNNDGMALFAKDGKRILAVNNEYANRSIMFGNREKGVPENADDVRKGKAAHGVSVVEIVQHAGRWSVVKDSPYTRKITADTPVILAGPAKGHDLLKTAADPSGTSALGTYNNCGNGRTPWGTYLACEENFNAYFGSSDETFQIPAEMARYGIGL